MPRKGWDPAPVLDAKPWPLEINRHEWRLIQDLFGHAQFDGNAKVQRLRPKLLAALQDSFLEGERVFQMAFPLGLAVTLNTYSNMETWMLKKMRAEVDKRIDDELDPEGAPMRALERSRRRPRDPEVPRPKKSKPWPHAFARTKGPRLVRVSRYSSAQPDEMGIDVIGGKIPIDRLVEAGVISGDTPELLFRRARWVKCAPGKGGVLVEVFEVDAGQQQGLF